MEIREASDDCPREVWITLDRKDRRFRCGGCGKQQYRYHDAEVREIRDLPILGVPVRLFLWRFRVECPSCGPRLEALNWLAPRARVSSRMAEDVARLCRVLPIMHVAKRFGLDWHTVKAIDKAWLERTLPELDMTGLGDESPGQSESPPHRRPARRSVSLNACQECEPGLEVRLNRNPPNHYKDSAGSKVGKGLNTRGDHHALDGYQRLDLL